MDISLAIDLLMGFSNTRWVKKKFKLDRSPANSTPFQNKSLLKPQLYFSVTFEPMTQLQIRKMWF